MTFKKGQSGNPNGRRKGSLSRRVQLAKLFEPHAEKLAEKAVELALKGDTNALRLCIERLIPKAQHEPIEIKLSNLLDQTNAPKKDAILRSALDGLITLTDAEKLIKLLNQHDRESSVPHSITTTDPIEASKIYQRIMRES